jgi:NitT/TauT family transport system ATP-binding protein
MIPIVKAEKINKQFAGKSVLRDASFEVEAGEFVCFIGPSGCGKSTLLRILLGLEKVDTGRVQIADNLKKALVFQNFALFPWLTVGENIGFGLKMSGINQNKIDKKVNEAIKQFNLTGSEKLHPKELSGGMKQRVGLARAQVMNPDVLFLDEPFSAVDALTAKELRLLLLDTWQNAKNTIVMVTHLVEEAVELADRIIILGNDDSLSSIIHEYKNDLARPRDNRSKEFFAIVDNLESRI